MKRLLVIRFGALGDLIHAAASLEAVKQARPDIEIHWLTSPAYRSLVSALPGVDRVWTWEKREGWRALWLVAQQLRQVGIDGVVNLHPSLKSLLLTGLLWPRRSIGYHKEKLRLKGVAQRVLTRRHAAQDFYQPFQQLLGLPPVLSGLPTLNPAALSTSLPPKQNGQQWLGIIPGVGSKRSNRAWEVASYVQLIESLLAACPTLRVLLVGGPDEVALGQQILQSLGEGLRGVENHCGRYDILGTAALLSQCDAVVGGDTGPMHLAAATGIPVVGVYGPTALSRTGPLAHGVAQMITPPETLTCWPCEQAECPYTGGDYLACMRQISVAQVQAAILEVL